MPVLFTQIRRCKLSVLELFNHYSCKLEPVSPPFQLFKLVRVFQRWNLELEREKVGPEKGNEFRLLIRVESHFKDENCKNICIVSLFLHSNLSRPSHHTVSNDLICFVKTIDGFVVHLASDKWEKRHFHQISHVHNLSRKQVLLFSFDVCLLSVVVLNYQFMNRFVEFFRHSCF